MLRRGTKAMIVRMLRDLTLPVNDFEDWSLDHLASNFLAKARPSSSWRDFWLDTWDVSIRMPKPDRFEAGDSAPISTDAKDATWDGRSFEVANTCMVVADFYDAQTIARGKIALNWLGQPDASKTVIDKIIKESPNIPRRELLKVRTTVEQRMRDRPDATSWLTVKGHLGHPRRLLVDIASDRPFFEEGAELAVAVIELCRAIGGTTLWSQHAKRLKLKRGDD